MRPFCASPCDRFPVGNWWELPDEARAALHQLNALGVSVAASRPCTADEEPRVEYIGTYGGAGQEELLLKAIMLEANEPGNVGKLSGDANTRHLFIRVDQTAGGAYVAARNGVLPGNLDKLPEEVTTLWVWADDTRVFQFTRSHRWVEHPVSVDVLMKPESFEFHADQGS